jgi:tetratricopeptide (TPR) repeat protein
MTPPQGPIPSRVGTGRNERRGQGTLAQAEKLVPRPVDPVVKKKKDDYDLAMTAGRAALAKDNFKGAINAFSEALRVMPGDTGGRQGARRRRSPLECCHAGRKNQSLRIGHESRFRTLDGKKFKEAVAAFDNALKLRPGDPAATSGKARAEAALVPMPDPRRTAYNAAIAAAAAAEKTGKYAEALKQYDAALTAVPKAIRPHWRRKEICRIG